MGSRSGGVSACSVASERGSKTSARPAPLVTVPSLVVSRMSCRVVSARVLSPSIVSR